MQCAWPFVCSGNHENVRVCSKVFSSYQNGRAICKDEFRRDDTIVGAGYRTLIACDSCVPNKTRTGTDEPCPGVCQTKHGK